MTDRCKWSLATLVVILLACLGAEPVPNAARLSAAEEEGDPQERVFLTPDRPTRLLLDRAEQLLAQKRYNEAVQALSSVLTAPEDFFYKPGDSRDKAAAGQTYRSLKNEARRLIGALPEAGRKSYELQYGADARRRLSDAIAKGDMEAVADVTRRYFHTEAGYDAMMLLGRYHMDQGHPLAAALCFEQLQKTGSVAAYEPELSILLALNWQRSGQSEKATAILTDLKRRSPDASMSIAGQPTPLFRGAGALDRRLAELASPARNGASHGWQEWTMCGGDPTRTMRTVGGMPMLLRPYWRSSVQFDPKAAETVANRGRQMYDQAVPALPALHPLAVGDVVLMRGPGRLAAVDLESGKFVWHNDTSDELKAHGDADADVPRPASPSESSPPTELFDRIWHDKTYGTMSSDGELVFAVEEPANQRVVLDAAGRRHSPLTTDAPSNLLAAYEIKQSQGKLRWSVGGPNGGEPKLEQAFFLGPPLPLQGRLYTIVEMTGEIRLIVLAADTGKLQWSQQLAIVDEEIAHDLTRHRSGISPSFADDVLVCPTTVGAVVAIDLTTRSLLWGYHYPRDAAVVVNRDVFGPWPQRSVDDLHGTSAPAWPDSQPMVANGHVLITPAESTQLHCLSLSDGRLEWKLEHGDNLYVACVHRDKALLVARSSISEVPLAGSNRGKPAGGDGRGAAAGISLGVGTVPSGRGFYADQSYYLPVQTPAGGEVVRIDLKTLQITERVASRDGSVPGNLICYRDQVISESPNWLQSNYQFASLQRRVETALAKNDQDPWALSHRAEMLMEQKKFAEAVALARQAQDKYSEQLQAPATAEGRAARNRAVAQLTLTRELLIDGLLLALEKDFRVAAQRQKIVAEVSKLVDTPQQRLRYLRIMAVGNEEIGELADALATYFELIDAAGPSDQMLTIDAFHTVRLDHWVSARLAGLVPRLPEELHKQYDEKVALRWLQIRKPATLPGLASHIAMFNGHPSAAEARVLLAARLDSPETILQRVRLLEPLADRGPAELAPEVIARLALLLTEAERPDDASPYYRRLVRDWPDKICVNGKTGRQLFEALPKDSPVRAVSQRTLAWPAGAVKVTQAGDSSGRYPAGGQGTYEMSVDGRQPKTPVRVFVDLQQQTISGLDSLGRPRWRMPLAREDDGSGRLGGSSSTSGKLDGYLFVMSLGSQVIAIDTLRAGRGSRGEGLLWSDDAGGAPGAEPTRRVRTEPSSSGEGHVNLARLWEDNDPEQHDDSPSADRLGDITPGGLVYMRSRELVCVDPISGKRNWVRRDIPSGAELICDNDLLMVILADSEEAIVLRTADGTRLGQCTVPAAADRWFNVGRRFVALRNGPKGAEDRQLALVDPWAKAVDWSLPVVKGTKAAVVDDATVALLDPQGHFTLLSVIDGKPIATEQLEPEPRLSGLYVQASRDYLILIANQPTRRSSREEQVEAPQESGGPIITGRIYALDRRTGKPLWPVPATVEKFALVPEQPVELPLLVLARAMHNASGEEQRTSFMFLDKRTGALASPTREYSRRINSFEITGDSDKKTVAVQMKTTSNILTLTMTDQPTPPEPPIQVDAHRYSESRILRGALGSVMKAVGKAAEQVQGLPVDDDERDKDLFGK